MKRFFKSIIACICGLTIVISSAVSPAFALDGVIGGVVDGVQSFTEWGVNNLNNFWKIIFGPDFNSASEEELKAAYDDYVTTLPATGYDSSGKLRYSPTHDSMGIFFGKGYAYCEHASSSSSYSGTAYFDCSSDVIRAYPKSGQSVFELSTVRLGYKGVAPVDGTYMLLNTPICSGYGQDGSGVQKSFSGKYSKSSAFYKAGASLTASGDDYSLRGEVFVSAFIQGIPPIYEITPTASFSGDTYNINTRPTSITGGNYGIVGDNGQITKVEDNSTIINETNNTYYNPATGQTVPITGWIYDYSDRSYKVTMEGGKTSTVTYGDENISITETTVNESGDTITNNYTIYYLVDGSGSENPPCEHDWQESSSTDPTCTLPGKITLSCTKCQQTKTETIPALGHNWQVKQTVTTQYDEEGNLTQQGYTIFECSTCHEQYKSPDGTAPPGGGSGTDPGGEEEGGGFLSWLFGKIGELLGTIGDGILNLLQTALEKIFGGLIDLVNSLFENLSKLVDLFGSVGEAFQVLWTWLPPEIIAILVAGVSIFVFVALLKFFMK